MLFLALVLTFLFLRTVLAVPSCALITAVTILRLQNFANFLFQLFSISNWSSSSLSLVTPSFLIFPDLPLSSSFRPIPASRHIFNALFVSLNRRFYFTKPSLLLPSSSFHLFSILSTIRQTNFASTIRIINSFNSVFSWSFFMQTYRQTINHLQISTCFRDSRPSQN